MHDRRHPARRPHGPPVLGRPDDAAPTPTGLSFAAEPVDGPVTRRVRSASCDAQVDVTSAVKGFSMITFARGPDGVSVHLRGPETSATPLGCPAGWEFYGVDLQVDAYLPLFPPSGLADLQDVRLPGSRARVRLGNDDWEIPTEQNVDVFVDRLARAGLLQVDPLVDGLRRGERPRGMSERVAQTRFRRAVGVSRRKLASIEQARRAADVLTAGGTAGEAREAGSYYDQPQLSRAMRWATGHSPAELRAGTRFLGW